MLNLLWGAMMLIGILYGAVTGRLAEVTDAALSCAKEAVALCIAMSGIVAMWMGIMQIARSSGLIDKMTEKMQPLLHFLFPKIPKEHPGFFESHHKLKFLCEKPDRFHLPAYNKYISNYIGL